MTKAHVNEECIGCGLCENLCPDAFEINDEGVAFGKECDIAKEELEDVVSQCPVSAISL